MSENSSRYSDSLSGLVMEGIVTAVSGRLARVKLPETGEISGWLTVLRSGGVGAGNQSPGRPLDAGGQRPGAGAVPACRKRRGLHSGRAVNGGCGVLGGRCFSGEQ